MRRSEDRAGGGLSRNSEVTHTTVQTNRFLRGLFVTVPYCVTRSSDQNDKSFLLMKKR
jgi:hypothetical protein